MKLADLKKLCYEATPGPWDARVNECSNTAKARHIWSDYGFIGRFDDESAEQNAAFIAAARTYLPKLIAVAEAAKAAFSGLPNTPYIKTEHALLAVEFGRFLAALEDDNG